VPRAPLQVGVDLRVLLEDARLVLRRDADAGVGDREDHRVAAPLPGRDPHLPLLRVLQRIGDEVAQDLRDLRLVGEEGREVVRLLDHQLDRLGLGQERPEHAAQRAEEVRHAELGGADRDLARLHLGQVEDVVDDLGQRLGAVHDETDLLVLLDGERPVETIEEDPRQADDRVHRRAQLVRHVRQEARLHLPGSLQIIGPLVQLGQQGHHAAVGVLQLLVELGQLLALGADLVERAQELLVLHQQLLDLVARRLPRQLGPQVGDPVRRQVRGAARELLGQDHARPLRAALDVEPIHQPPGADDPQPHPGLRPVAPVQDPRQLGDPGAVIRHRRGEGRRIPRLGGELDPAAARVAVGVAADLRHGRGDARLVAGVEAEEGRDLPGALAGEDHVRLAPDLDGQDRVPHRCTARLMAAPPGPSRRPARARPAARARPRRSPDRAP
jgi:hypothetical protein